MDFLPIVLGFIGGVGGGFFAIRTIHHSITKQLQAFELTINEHEKKIAALQKKK